MIKENNCDVTYVYFYIALLECNRTDSHKTKFSFKKFITFIFIISKYGKANSKLKLYYSIVKAHMSH